MRSRVAEIIPSLSIESKNLTAAIDLLGPIDLALADASEKQRPLIERLHQLLLAAELELEND